LEDPSVLAALVKDETRIGDLVVCLGAGSISKWAYSLPAELENIKTPKRVAQ